MRSSTLGLPLVPRGGGYVLEFVAWSQVSLLDLALRFGHYEVAHTLGRLGIKYCALTLEDFQAGTFSNVIAFETLGTSTLHDELGHWKQVDGGWARLEKHCNVNGNNSSRSQTNRAGLCPWPEMAGQWVSDWDLPVHVARGNVDTPTTRLALNAAAEGELDLLRLDEAGAKVQLLDAVLLLGNAEASLVLSELCGQMRPLRIWAFSDLVCMKIAERDGPFGLVTRPGLASPQYLEAHAAAGAVFKAGDFQDYGYGGHRTLLELVVLGGHVELASIMKANEPTRAFKTSFDDLFGFLDFNAGMQTFHVRPAALDVLDILGIGYSSLKFRNERLHFDLTCTQCRMTVDLDLRGQSFLFVAILLCDFTQVARMTAGGAGLSPEDSLDALLNEQSWHQEVCWNCGLQIIFPYDSAPGWRWKTIEVALSSAFRAAFDKVQKCTATVAQGGFVQQMNLMTPLAHKIFGFAAGLPTGLQRVRSHCLSSLDKDPLLEIVLFGAASSSTEPSNEQADQSPAFAREESPAPLPAAAEEDVLVEEALSKEDDLGLAAAMQQSEAEALSQEQQEVHKAMLLSKAETFSNDHVVLWRLAKCSARVADALSTSDELSACHDGVREAGCELTPSWAGGAVLLVPLTLELYEELGLKFAPYHVLSLSSGRERLEAALRSVPYKKRGQLSTQTTVLLCCRQMILATSVGVVVELDWISRHMRNRMKRRRMRIAEAR
ncbi:unnamed protein product [Polarella glacialis]|uniref:Uncharacterized protein n=1 Tax=Polarella glacialis TaxID=89957 RepID=A0A813GT32_POLGL|nr:unnamed protein product [Polarella glacialis]